MKAQVMMFDENALLILNKRYLIKDVQGEPIETPEEMFKRVADAVAQAEDSFGSGKRGTMSEAFFRMMSNLQFLPNSPTLMNAGRTLGQLSACFVLPVEDSLDSIFESVKETAKIHQTGGGTGFSFSKLRPRDDVVESTMGAASGPISFIKVFNIATEVIKQGGTRRGANMGVLRIDHPDIEEFLSIKNNPFELTNFNLSVAVTDAFMEACQKNAPFGLINPRTKKEVVEVSARNLLRLIAESAWATGEPGILFIDTINRANPTPHIGEIEATNPCGEMPLLPYESCCLGSINLSSMVQNGSIDWGTLKDLTHLSVRFLDDVIEASNYPLPEIEKVTRANRKVGLGVMGFAHMLIRLGISYDSSDAVRLADTIMGFISKESRNASGILAEERGVFPYYRESIWDKQGLPQRNATTTTIAPTGTLSIIAGVSGGIEPIYDTHYSRVLFGNLKVNIIDPLFAEMKDRLDAREVKRLFRVAYEVSPDYHLQIQKAFQDHVDNAVSKTVNLPAEATPETVLEIYHGAYHMGLKGITVFRDKSREHQVLACGTCQPC
jgi:ribonucleoside-diphosphate reductase alpha chain